MAEPTIVERLALPADLGLARVKNYLRVYDDEHDSTIQLLIEAAVEFIQTLTRQTFRRTQYSQIFRRSPLILTRFPVLSVDLIEQTEAESFVEVASDGYQLSESVPPQIFGPSLSAPVRITWTAGYDDWPKDLVLLVWQMCEENFDRRGTTPASAQAAQFSRAHQLALEQYCTHHDSVR
jgi:hypothetical protein